MALSNKNLVYKLLIVASAHKERQLKRACTALSNILTLIHIYHQTIMRLKILSP